MRRMYDAAWPPANPPPWEAVAFYIGGDTPHVWLDSEIARQPARWRLPIFVRSMAPWNPVDDAAAAVGWLRAHHVPEGSTVAWDMETAIEPGYCTDVTQNVRAAGYHTLIYGSGSTVRQNPPGSAGWWGAHWGIGPQLEAGYAATQYADAVELGTDYDASLLSDALPLWDTQAKPPPPPPPPSVKEPAVLEFDTTIPSHPLLIDFGTKTMDLLSVAPSSTPLVVRVTFLDEAATATTSSLSWGAGDTTVTVPAGVKQARVDVVSGAGLPLAIRFNQ